MSTKRSIVLRTVGERHGPITALLRPAGLAERLKPFVFLDYLDAPLNREQGFSFHPHSGIATLTYLLCGDLAYEDTTGQQGVVRAGGIEWMRAGSGVWHRSRPLNAAYARGFQVWLALPPDLEEGPGAGCYVAPESVPVVGPAHVLLGRYGGVESLLAFGDGALCLHLQLKAGETWRFAPPAGHDVAWVYVHEGRLRVGDDSVCGELAAFEAGAAAIDFCADGATSFLLGSAAHHDYPLVYNETSVHTSLASLRRSEGVIREISVALEAAHLL